MAKVKARKDDMMLGDRKGVEDWLNGMDGCRNDGRAGARASGRRAVGKRPMTTVGRAVEKGETQGFMKVVVDADTEEILGAAILGVGGDEVIHAVLDVMSAKAPYTTLSRTMHIHPTVTGLIPTMLREMSPLQ